MKRFTTPTHLEDRALEFQIGALVGYYGHRRLAELADRDSVLGLESFYAFKTGIAHGAEKRRRDEAAGKVVRL